MGTGEVEVVLETGGLEVLNRCKTLPFPIELKDESLVRRRSDLGENIMYCCILGLIPPAGRCLRHVVCVRFAWLMAAHLAA